MTAEYGAKEQRVLALRKERLTKDFLQRVFLSKAFEDGMSEMATRSLEEGAEGGLVVYKNISNANFYISRKYGLPIIKERPELFGINSVSWASVRLNDSVDELFSNGIYPGELLNVRMGHLHYHPAETGRPTFSSRDMENFEEDISDPSLAEGFVIHMAQNMFNAVAAVNWKSSEIEVVGITLPRLLSNKYQAFDFNRISLTQHDEILRECGFRVVRLRAPFLSGRVTIDQSFASAFSSLAGE